MTYPKHIYDSVRLEIATQLLQKEFEKLFPTLDSSTLHTHIEAWRRDPSQYHLEDGMRDFWDIFAATLESIKLKPSFTAFLTAENYHWHQETIPLHSIKLSSQLEQLKKLDALHWNDSTTIGDVMAAIRDDPTLNDQKRINDSHSRDSQDAYPIIARRLDGSSVRVMDGNRRSLRASLYGHTEITAWVAEVDGEIPRNFWVPVNDLFQITKLFRAATTPASKQAVRDSLEILFQASSIARINYETRILSSNPWADELFSLPPSS